MPLHVDNFGVCFIEEMFQAISRLKLFDASEPGKYILFVN